MTPDTNQTERKVQLTGGSTFTVSLPKDWAKKQGVEPGSIVNLYTRGERLVMSWNHSDSSEKRPSTTIDASTHDRTALARSIEAAYVAGADEIVLEGLDDSSNRRAATQAIRQFVGLEVMTENERTLTAQTMLDSADLSPTRTLAQIQRTALEMHGEAITAVTEADGDLGKRIAEQDDTVDRLFALISREFQRSLVDPNVSLHRDGLTSFEYYMAARQLERVADHAEKIALMAGDLDDPPAPELAESLESYGADSRQIVEESLDGLLNESSELLPVIEDSEDRLSEMESFDEKLHRSQDEDSYRLGVVLDSIVRTVQYGVNIAEAGLQARYRTDQ